MNINGLMHAMQCGEEIEINLNGKCYFLQPDYKRFNENWCIDGIPYPFTVIYDSSDYENPKEIFVGTTEEVMDYKFESKHTLRKNINEFKFV